MAYEYSYFRAEGQTLAAIETVEEAKKEFGDLKAKMCAKFGAEEISCRTDPATGALGIYCFYFRPPAKPPEGWADVQEPQMSYDKTSIVCYFAKPAENSPDQFHVASVIGLMARSNRNLNIREVLGSGDLPGRELPAGSYSGWFVREQTFKEPGKPEKAHGMYEDGVMFVFGSNSACKMGETLAYKKYGDDWYMRVPNLKDTDTPAFTPPDAVALPFKEMIDVDAAEYLRTRPRNSYPYPGIH